MLFIFLFKENQREIVQHQSADQTKGKSAAGKSQPTETSKKGQVGIFVTNKTSVNCFQTVCILKETVQAKKVGFEVSTQDM